jgi:hypothetical protein
MPMNHLDAEEEPKHPIAVSRTRPSRSTSTGEGAPTTSRHLSGAGADRMAWIPVPRKVLEGCSYLSADSYCLRYGPAARRPQMIDGSKGAPRTRTPARRRIVREVTECGGSFCATQFKRRVA